MIYRLLLCSYFTLILIAQGFAQESNDKLILGKWKIDTKSLENTIVEMKKKADATTDSTIKQEYREKVFGMILAVAFLKDRTQEYKKNGKVTTTGLDTKSSEKKIISWDSPWRMSQDQKTLFTRFGSPEQEEVECEILKINSEEMLLKSIQKEGEEENSLILRMVKM